MWQLEQAYCFRVLVHCFQTVKSRALVRGVAAKENDAQAAFAAACDKYECALDIMNLRTQQTNTIKEMELTESQKKGIESWLELWGSKVLDLEEHLDHVVSDIDKRA